MIDWLLLAATAGSGLFWLGYGLFRHDAEEEQRRIVKFWAEIFMLCSLLLLVRVFYAVFPAVSPDKFFFFGMLLAGAFYLYFKLTRSNAPAEQRKPIRLAREAFICLLAVFLLRGFFYDWFRIPSSSMLPTLVIGDMVLTDKNRYGYRLPILNVRITPGSPPARGDIIVFKKPGSDLFYIKRIIGLPGDTVRYGDDKSITVNGEDFTWEIDDTGPSGNVTQLREEIDGSWHDIYVDAGSNVLFQSPDAEHCSLNHSPIGAILNCKVPPGRYFVLGDNRDHSNDSRFWGFVPEENIVGPASHVVFNHRLITALELSQLQRLWLPLRLTTQ